MEYVDLGTSGIKISPLCLGGMSFGEVFPDFHQWVIDESETTNVIARAYELGINFIDTANGYARGTSEQFIGRSLRKLGIPRESMVLASKVFFNEGALGKAAIEREIDKTLTNLQTDYLDLYIIHRYDYNHPIEETLEALDGLVRAGKVRALGASEMYAYQLHNMQLVAERNGWTKFCSMQLHHNLLYRENEREMIPVCRQYDMATVKVLALFFEMGFGFLENLSCYLKFGRPHEGQLEDQLPNRAFRKLVFNWSASQASKASHPAGVIR